MVMFKCSQRGRGLYFLCVIYHHNVVIDGDDDKAFDDDDKADANDDKAADNSATAKVAQTMQLDFHIVCLFVDVLRFVFLFLSFKVSPVCNCCWLFFFFKFCCTIKSCI